MNEPHTSVPAVFPDARRRRLRDLAVVALGLIGVAAVAIPVRRTTAQTPPPATVAPTALATAGAGVEPPQRVRAALGQVHLPVLGRVENAPDVCETFITVQNAGSELSRAVLITWGDPSACPPDCAGPLTVECTGLLRPGAGWTLLGAQIPGGTWHFGASDLPEGAKSAVAFSFNARTLAEIGVAPGSRQVVADVLCAALLAEVPGRCDGYRRFKQAFDRHGEFARLPLERAYGAPLTAAVARTCPGNVNKVLPIHTGYSGTAGDAFGGYDQVMNVSSYYASMIQVDSAATSALYIQNAGLDCASVEVWFHDTTACHTSRLCRSFLLASGSSATLSAADCVGADWRGSAWLRSSQPLAAAVDVLGRDTLMSYSAVPAELAYSFTGRPAYSAGSTIADGPLLLRGAGWESRIHVQNLSSLLTADVQVSFYDAAGAIVRLPDRAAICPRGQAIFDLPRADGAGRPVVASVRIESLTASPGEGGRAEPANIGGVAEVLRRPVLGDGPAASAFAYELLPEKHGYDWPVGSGAGLIAVPGVVVGSESAYGRRTRLAVANLAVQPGFTNVAVYLFDQNSLVRTLCRQLRERQIESIDLPAWNGLTPELRGGALVSAVAWITP
jgi:hypothetical protein